MALQTPRQRALHKRPSYTNTSPSLSAEHTTTNNTFTTGGGAGAGTGLGLSASTAGNRKLSLRALTGSGPPTPDARTPTATAAGRMQDVGEEELQVGDVVNVPGRMIGTVKFVGAVRGKSGRFVGVELEEEFATRGKNDGDVDGVHYFNTFMPGAGIFLPIHRAEKRYSPASATALDSFPAAPSTPSLHSTRAAAPNHNHRPAADSYNTTNTPSLPHSKFSQTMGPGSSTNPMRPSSPLFKPKRPSLPRPESPFRKQPPNLAPTPARQLSQSTRGGVGGARPGLFTSASTATPAKGARSNGNANPFNPRASTTSTTAATPGARSPARPYSRNGSRLGYRTTQEASGAIAEGDVGVAHTSGAGRTTSGNAVPSFSQPLRSPSRIGSSGTTASTGGRGSGGLEGAESAIVVAKLKAQLAERDRRLDEQARSLKEMEGSVRELSALLPTEGGEVGAGARGGPVLGRKSSSQLLSTPVASNGEEGDDAATMVTSLRQALREKNEKLAQLTRDFDAHRADFRSTLDSLEMASSETERVYEAQKGDLLARVAALEAAAAAAAMQLESEKAGRRGGEGREEEEWDFEGVARQLRVLEELVQELEEGLEESRRGEAEARGEVEFLRGEVERGRSELRRERERERARVAKVEERGEDARPVELEKRDGEIRGLKAIIQRLSLSPAPDAEATHPGDSSSNADELANLRQTLRERDAELEALAQQLRTATRDRDLAPPSPPTTTTTTTTSNGHGVMQNHARNESERTAKAPSSPDGGAANGGLTRARAGTVKPTFAQHSRQAGSREEQGDEIPVRATNGDDVADDMDAGDEKATTNGRHGGGEMGGSILYCEMCESSAHDTLECTKFANPKPHSRVSTGEAPVRDVEENGGWEEDEGRGQHGRGTEEEDEDEKGVLARKEKAALGHGAGLNGLEGKGTAVEGKAAKEEQEQEQDKWCALCEKDGHLAFDCPEEQY